jgi:curved DNA-binding protein CbpA
VFAGFIFLTLLKRANLKNYYFVLGLSIYAKDAEIKRAYRKLALIYHPDKNSSLGAQAIFVEINEAYEVLRDPQKKFFYDQQFSAPASNDTYVVSTPRPTPHRDPRYRSKPTGYVYKSRAQERVELMQRLAPHARIISKITMGLCLLLFLDFILPTKTHVHQVTGVTGEYVSDQSVVAIIELEDGKFYTANSASFVINGYGKTYEADNILSQTLLPGTKVDLCLSPILSVPKRIEFMSFIKLRIGDSIYGNLFFFPIIWFLASLIGVFARMNSEMGLTIATFNTLFFIFNFFIFIHSL